MDPKGKTPSPAMMAPVERIARYIETLNSAHLKQTFAAGNVTIIENFAPYVFTGAAAARRWEKGFRLHARGLSGLRHAFGTPQDFSLDGDQAYFSLPTTWTGRANGKRFSEQGGWAFVLVRKGHVWRVRNYGWAVTSFSLTSRPGLF